MDASPPVPAASPAALLRTRGLAKRFGSNEVLRGIDLDVLPGDRIAILGARDDTLSEFAIQLVDRLGTRTPVGH